MFVYSMKAFQRIQLLYRSTNFTSNRQDLRKIYLTFIRSVLENSAVVWHSGLSVKNRLALERVQKAAVRLMMGGKYVDYKHGLTFLNIYDSNTRRKNQKIQEKIDKQMQILKISNSRYG